MVDEAGAHKVPARRWQRALLWAAALGLTYGAGKFGADLVKWTVLMYLAPGGEAKLILLGYLASALFPVLLCGLPAIWSWHRLFRIAARGEAGLLLAFELAFLTYVGAGDVQRGLADFLP